VSGRRGCAVCARLVGGSDVREAPVEERFWKWVDCWARRCVGREEIMIMSLTLTIKTRRYYKYNTPVEVVAIGWCWGACLAGCQQVEAVSQR